ncbi:MAG: 50S ribosomal protein L13 [Alphaproteobacteria bacterium]|nr:50S ribosomal protein L13 [Alphaproteobacteria bacterium]OJV15277.1 MAG: 50S ribosomal protein L13 [Alphaproteobacteria bacterium 33-17]
MSTFVLKEKDVQKNWVHIDASGLVLGRLAAEVAKILRGKHKATFTPHMDCGDYVVITNAEKVRLTGRKADRKDGKFYYRHTGHPGGIKEITAGKLLEGKYPERVIEFAVKRMISRGTMGRKQMSHLFIYAGEEHPHTAQQPATLDIRSKNPKNSQHN